MTAFVCHDHVRRFRIMPGSLFSGVYGVHAPTSMLVVIFRWHILISDFTTLGLP